jgi:CheY-like chemotaxis protein
MARSPDPLVVLPAMADTTPDGASASPAATPTALLVDDEPAMRSYLAHALGVLGYATLTAANGAEALALAERFDGSLALTITDIHMPDLSGPDLARALAAAQHAMPILFISGRRPPRDLSDAVVGHPAAFLPKPFTFDELRRALAELVELPPVVRAAPSNGA